MENASKALIIAGAILISILLIGIGMFVYTSSQGTISTAVSSMSAQEKEMYNQKFQQYVGTQSGASVRALLAAVKSNNSIGEGNQITINTGATVDGITTTAGDGKDKNNTLITHTTSEGNIPSTKYYKVDVETGKSGLIVNIKISENT